MSSIPINCKHKSKRMPPKPYEVIEICHEVLVDKQHHTDVAKRHNMSANAVQKYITKARKNSNFISELYSN